MKLVDLTKKLKPYEGKWATLSPDYKKVLGAGDTLKEAKKKAEKKTRNYIFIKLPPFNVNYVPFS